MADGAGMGSVRPGQFVDYCGARLFVPFGHFDEAHMVGGGQPEPHVLSMFARLVGAGDVVIDVGANIGTHSFALASLVGGAGRVYAVEADIDNAASLRVSIVESAATTIRLLAVAAADGPGMIRCLSTTATNSVFSAAAGEGTEKVAVTVRLDDVVDGPVAFIKLDIEGAELLALHGLSRTIAQSRPTVLSEYSPTYMAATLGRDRSEEFFDFFAERDYVCFYLDPWGGLAPVPDVAALHAVREAALDRLTWNHIDVLFAPREHRLVASAS